MISEFCNFEKKVASVFGPSKILPGVPFLHSDDDRLDDYRDLGLNVEGILAWVNSADSVIRRNRTQVLESFPVLVPALLLTENREWMKFLDIQVTIDRGYPLTKTLTEVCCIDASSIRFLMAQSPAEVGSDWITRPVQLIWATRIVPAAYRPRSREDWRLLWTYWSQIGLCDKGLADDRWYDTMPAHGRRAFFREHLFVEMCRNGYSTASKMRFDRMTGGRPDAISQIVDYYRFIEEWIRQKFALYVEIEPGVMYCSPEEDLTPDWSESLLIRYSLSNLIKQSNFWHRAIILHIEQHIPQDGNLDQVLNEWPALLRGPVSMDGLDAISLTCARDLVVEGRRLKHCVSSYDSRCATGESHIISIRDSNENSRSTAEIYLLLVELDRWEPRVRQHRGFDNTAPSPECVQLLDLVIVELKRPESQPWLREIAGSAAKNVWHKNLHIKEEIVKKVLPNYDEALTWINQRYTEYLEIRVPIDIGPCDDWIPDDPINAFRIGACIRCEYGHAVNLTESCQVCRTELGPFPV